jgi:hypothetical protein
MILAVAKFYLIIALLVPEHLEFNDTVPAKINVHTLTTPFDELSDCEAFAAIAKAPSVEYQTNGPVVGTQCVNIPEN